MLDLYEKVIAVDTSLLIRLIKRRLTEETRIKTLVSTGSLFSSNIPFAWFSTILNRQALGKHRKHKK